MEKLIIRKILYRQGWHLLALLALTAMSVAYINQRPEAAMGSWGGIGTSSWFYIAIVVAAGHEIYVWLVWRLELYADFFSRRFGVMPSFKAHALIFLTFLAARGTAIIGVAVSNRGSLGWASWFVYGISIIIIPIVGYLFYSLLRYFTIRRAIGIDHFVKDFDQPIVNKGIFRFTNNGMYTYGLLVYYLPGLLLLSEAALAIGLFYHIYIWVHYYCTEKPDMTVIYGSKK